MLIYQVERKVFNIFEHISDIRSLNGNHIERIISLKNAIEKKTDTRKAYSGFVLHPPLYLILMEYALAQQCTRSMCTHFEKRKKNSISVLNVLHVQCAYFVTTLVVFNVCFMCFSFAMYYYCYCCSWSFSFRLL